MKNGCQNAKLQLRPSVKLAQMKAADTDTWVSGQLSEKGWSQSHTTESGKDQDMGRQNPKTKALQRGNKETTLLESLVQSCGNKALIWGKNSSLFK